MKLIPAQKIENQSADDHHESSTDHHEPSTHHHHKPFTRHTSWTTTNGTVNRSPPREHHHERNPTHTFNLPQPRTSNTSELLPTAHLLPPCTSDNRAPPTTSKILPQVKTHNSPPSPLPYLSSSHIYNSSPTTLEELCTKLNFSDGISCVSAERIFAELHVTTVMAHGWRIIRSNIKLSLQIFTTQPRFFFHFLCLSPPSIPRKSVDTNTRFSRFSMFTRIQTVP